MNALQKLITSLTNSLILEDEMDPLVLFANGKPKLTNCKCLTLKENKSSFVAINKSQKILCRITVDNELIKTGERCDYGLWVKEDNCCYLIELKGCDVEKAFSQIAATYDFFIAHYANEGFEYRFRVVPTKVKTAPHLENKRKMLQRRTGIVVKIKETLMEEHI